MDQGVHKNIRNTYRKRRYYKWNNNKDYTESQALDSVRVSTIQKDEEPPS